MKDHNTIWYGCCLVLISCKCEFTMDWVDISGDANVKTYKVGKKMIVVYYRVLYSTGLIVDNQKRSPSQRWYIKPFSNTILWWNRVNLGKPISQNDAVDI